MQKHDLIDFQLAQHAPQTVALPDGETVITPSPQVPQLADRRQVSLAGRWQVTYWPFAAEEAALAAGGDAQWQEIAQPGKVFYYDPAQSPDGIPGWNRVSQAHLDADDGAVIRRTVQVPAAWAGQRVLLYFDGIYPAGRIYWDGVPIAEQWSGLTPIEIDLTEQASPGPHTLAIRFYRRHPSLRLDMPRHAADFVGLSRDALLHVVEPVHVADWRVAPALADDNVTGSLTGEVRLRNLSAQSATASLRLTLTDAAGCRVAACPLRACILPGETVTVPFTLPAGAVQPWSAERPTRYVLAVQLAVPGQHRQALRTHVGFRRFVARDGRATLNGAPVKFRGVNHLSHSPDGGLCTADDWLRQCLTLMKRANINTIRTHYYGPCQLAELCDELGLFLLQELPIDWGTDYVQLPEHLGPILQRMEAGVRRDRNRPSVMCWCIGNENMSRNEAEYPAFQEHLRLAGEMVKRVDPTRPVLFPPPGPANAIRGILETRQGDIADIHYSFTLLDSLRETGQVTNPRTWGMLPGVDGTTPTFETHTREALMARGWSGTWFSSEFGINNMLADLLHAPYTSIIADELEDPLSGKDAMQVFYDRLSREWGRMRDDPTCLGGAYFSWIAAGAGDPWGWVRWAEDADWGVVTRDLLPKPAFWAMRALYAPVRFPARLAWQPGETALRFTVRNAFHAFHLSECTLRTQMGGGPPWMGTLQAWRDVPLAGGAPGETIEISIPLWNDDTRKTLASNQPVVCRCTLLDPTGFRVTTADIIVMPPELSDRTATHMLIGPDA